MPLYRTTRETPARSKKRMDRQYWPGISFTAARGWYEAANAAGATHEGDKKYMCQSDISKYISIALRRRRALRLDAAGEAPEARQMKNEHWNGPAIFAPYVHCSCVAGRCTSPSAEGAPRCVRAAGEGASTTLRLRRGRCGAYKYAGGRPERYIAPPPPRRARPTVRCTRRRWRGP